MTSDFFEIDFFQTNTSQIFYIDILNSQWYESSKKILTAEPSIMRGTLSVITDLASLHKHNIPFMTPTLESNLNQLARLKLHSKTFLWKWKAHTWLVHINITYVTLTLKLNPSQLSVCQGNRYMYIHSKSITSSPSGSLVDFNCRVESSRPHHGQYSNWFDNALFINVLCIFLQIFDWIT